MTQQHDIDLDRNLVAVEFGGTLAADGVLALRDRICADPRYRVGMNQVWDFSRVEDVAVAPADLKGMVERQNREAFRQPVRCAVVAPRDATFGLGRMYEALTDEPDLEIGVFRDRDSALAWVESDAAQ